MRSEKDKMLAGALYRADSPELIADNRRISAWMERFNATGATPDARLPLMQEAFGHVGRDVVIRPPFHCDYGYNISLGDGVFLNFNCIILDVVAVTIGDGTQIGPGVQILAADHPRDAAERAGGLEFGRPISIGANVWIGAGALIMPGVSIGDNAVIGAGSVVTRDIPADVVAFGIPCRVVREISNHDRRFYWRDREIDITPKDLT